MTQMNLSMRQKQIHRGQIDGCQGVKGCGKDEGEVWG